jgi:NAD(P) transhydrogenase
MLHGFAVDFKAKNAPLLPIGIYTSPEASMVGETEESLVAKGVAFVIGRADY